LFAFYLSVRVRSALGFKVDKDELSDFELDYIPVDEKEIKVASSPWGIKY